MAKNKNKKHQAGSGPAVSSSTITFRQKLVLVVCSVLLVLVLGELGIRTRDALFKGRGFFNDERNLVVNYRSLKPFRTFGPNLYNERNGVRYCRSVHEEYFSIKKPEGTFRIVCFGGSSTENINSVKIDGTHYPLVLQNLLRAHYHRDNIEVINLGTSGYSTAHCLIMFELDVLSWEPDLIIVSENINDLQASYFPNFTFDYSNKFSHPSYGLPNLRERFTVPNLLFQHSQLYWEARREILALGRLIRGEKNVMHRKSLGEAPLPEAVQVFERNLKSFVYLARPNGIGVLFGSQPLQPSEEYFNRHMQYKDYNDVAVYPLQEEFVKHHQAFNESIRKVAEETGSDFVENDGALGGKEEYFIDLVHYTPAGVKKLAENYAEYIIGHSLVK